MRSNYDRINVQDHVAMCIVQSQVFCEKLAAEFPGQRFDFETAVKGFGELPLESGKERVTAQFGAGNTEPEDHGGRCSRADDERDDAQPLAGGMIEDYGRQ